MPRFFAPSLAATLLAVTLPIANAQDRPSPEEWSAQQRAATTPVGDGDAAIIAANMRALGERCGFSAAEQSQLAAVSGRDGAAFEASVERHLPDARRRADEQKRAPGFQQNCEFLRLRLETQTP